MSTGARILVVDDQPNIVDMLITVLTFHGFTVTSASTAAQAQARAEEDKPDLVVLDVMLPDGDGFEVCRQLRARGHRFGIVFLTAKDTRQDLVSGLTYGADDYVAKPFAVEELLARIRAVLRRVNGVQETPSPVLRYADLELDEETLLVRRAGQPVSLSPTEFKLLRYLMLNAGRVLSRTQILEAVWSYDFGGDSNVVDTYVGYLRRKLDRLGEPLFVTHRGFGYALRLDRG
ncbi:MULTISPECIES: response regulator transcription factor [unclassified Micromonospora]|uniref:response regulator transcription factor n=1 Tax=Micromonospora TaxID=1873 RepID=UPI001C22DC3B|nr:MULTISPECIES: response regulator transcription factor [unclassified Micromonospora]MBU8858627.1 response regulator transcription factor [Micromonospora sp. WMMB482]MDM4784271.1 response regulator transcription factor [Micromonospora sp. b486]